MGRLQGKVCIITGSTSGIGKSAAFLFAKEGAHVVVVGRREKLCNEVACAIKELGGEAIYVKTDVTNEEDIKNLINVVIKAYGRIDVLYNNAGVEFERDVTEATMDDWDIIINTNLRSVFLTMKYAIPHMTKGGSIINTASIAALMGLSQHSIYSASKGGITALTMSVACDCLKRGIRVNCICPGPTWTPIVTRHIKNKMFERLAKNIIKKMVPMGRYALPEEIANLGLFLASDESSFITGAVIPCDGGTSEISYGLDLPKYSSLMKK